MGQGKELSADGISTIKQALEDACKDQEKGLPGVSFFAVNQDGKQLFAHAAGKRGHGSDEPLTLDSVFWIASFTKLITSIACMQMVEQGKLALDDVEQVEKLSPELRDVKVLQEDGTLVPKKRGITLRMLLTHTAGFGYSFFIDRLRDYNGPIGFDEFSGDFSDYKQPLVHQPGETWEYGVSLDWAGVLVERASGLKLNDYFHQHIFEPLGLKNITMFPSEDMKRKLVYTNQRAPDGTLSRRYNLLRQPLILSPDDTKTAFHSGGAGLFANPQDYTKILATLLNDGTSPNTGKQILTKDTVDTMFQNQMPDWPDFARAGLKAAKPEHTNPTPEVYPIPGNGPQGWGLSFMITPSPTGRSASGVHWAGITNLFWWCDREKGVAGVIATQVLPFADPKLIPLWVNVETAVYNALG